MLSGLSRTMTELIVFQGIQGLGADGVIPLAQAITGEIFSPRERFRYQGYTGFSSWPAPDLALPRNTGCTSSTSRSPVCPNRTMSG
jgi:MFS family permease